MRIATLNWIIIFRALTDYKITCALPAFAGLLKLGDYMLLPVKPRLYDGKKMKQKIIIAVVVVIAIHTQCFNLTNFNTAAIYDDIYGNIGGI